MEFRLLGPLYADAGTGAGPATISQPLLRSALAVLLLRANRPCPREWLTEALWGNEPPDQPEAALRVCISRLRKCLGPCAVRLESVGQPGGRAPGHRQQHGYQMTVRPGELDLDEFGDLFSQGEAELETGNSGAAASALMQALALWGDPPLPDLPDTPVINAAAAGLMGQRRSASDALVEARLAEGEHQQLLGELRSAAMADPGRERTCAQLMRAYAALGMRKEALAAYQRAREAILEEQGAEPGPVLFALQSQILAAEIGPEAPPAHAAAVLDGAAGALPPWQAPAPPPDFTGRGPEIADVKKCLSGQGVPVTVITGGPGAGKSALAAAAAMELRDQFPGGQIYAELGGVGSPRAAQEALADVLHSLGVRPASVPPPGAARTALYRTLLAWQPVLLIADDAASAAQVRPLIPPGAGSAVLVTSRGRLPGLAGARIIALDELPADDALALLRAAAGSPAAEIDPDSAAVITGTCAGLPLALRLAGGVLAARPGLTYAALARQLGGGLALDLLKAGDVSVRQAIATSYRSVSGAAQAALVAVAASVPGDVPAWALDAAAAGAPVGEELVGAGLLAMTADESAGLRYRLHPLTRAYAAQLAAGAAGTGPRTAVIGAGVAAAGSGSATAEAARLDARTARRAVGREVAEREVAERQLADRQVAARQVAG